ncbi:MAG: hypothetical protein BMS9Abin05_2275 [Rhodothermia bacterium]|nr:MAG: hypothetical protein BMS9Abin05_2275 [Rhodothermia bacterium]
MDNRKTIEQLWQERSGGRSGAAIQQEVLKSTRQALASASNAELQATKASVDQLFEEARLILKLNQRNPDQRSEWLFKSAVFASQGIEIEQVIRERRGLPVISERNKPSGVADTSDSLAGDSRSSETSEIEPVEPAQKLAVLLVDVELSKLDARFLRDLHRLAQNNNDVLETDYSNNEVYREMEMEAMYPDKKMRHLTSDEQVKVEASQQKHKKRHMRLSIKVSGIKNAPYLPLADLANAAEILAKMEHPPLTLWHADV